MAEQRKRIVEYETDNGEKVPIIILYGDSDDLFASAETRFVAGGFGSENVKCSGFTPRRKLKPRYITFQNDDGKRLDVIYKTHDGFLQVINGGQTSMEGVPIRYAGEEYAICTD